jgi:S-formylglutathione hydrolase FrmB
VRAHIQAAALTLALVLALGAPAAAEADLTVVKREQLSPRLSEYTLHTDALSEDTVVRVLLPADYAAHPEQRYPVLYLLHGCCDYDVRGSQAWTTHGEAEQATAGLPLIVVMPDGGRAGFYTDWYRKGAGGPPEWERYHIGQLIPWIDASFQTRAAREGRAVVGLSMGGFGAFSYAARHPDRFVAAASFSGAVDTNINPDVLDGLTVQDGATPGDVFGVRETDEVRWRAHNPWDLAENLRGLHLELRTGNGQPGPYDDGAGPPDALESTVHDMTVSTHERLTALGIPHIFDDYGPGTHTWPYWARDLRTTLPEVMAVLANPPAPPQRVAFTAVEPHYEVYGWSVTLDRPVLEFSRLSDAGAEGFTLEGSGKGEVITPAVYPPGAPYAVTAGDQRLAADAAGRLHVPVDLGPANTTQQYTPGADTQLRRVTVRISAVATSTAPQRVSVPCSARGRIRVTIPSRLRHVRATLRGKRVRVHGRRHRFVVVDLRGRRAGRYRLTVVGRDRRGTQRVTRTFRICASRKQRG